MRIALSIVALWAAALAPVALATVSGSGAITTLVVCTGSAWVVG